MIRLTTTIPREARAWRNDPRIMSWCRQNEIISEWEQEEWEKRIRTDRTIKMFGIEGSPDKTGFSLWTPIGVTGLTSISQSHRTAEFSLYIAPSFQRKGFAREALKALLDYAFINLGLECVWGESFVGNPALHLFREIGFKEEGVHRSRYYKNGERIDAASISLLRGDWKI